MLVSATEYQLVLLVMVICQFQYTVQSSNHVVTFIWSLPDSAPLE